MYVILCTKVRPVHCKSTSAINRIMSVVIIEYQNTFYSENDLLNSVCQRERIVYIALLATLSWETPLLLLQSNLLLFSSSRIILSRLNNDHAV